MNIHARMHNQRARVQDGIQNGSLTPEEVHNIRAQRAANAATLNEARANGASPDDLRAERQQMLDGVSQMIAQYKHN
jgi:hypothetical protein